MVDHKVSCQLLVDNIATFINRLRTKLKRLSVNLAEFMYFYMHAYIHYTHKKVFQGDVPVISYELILVSLCVLRVCF